MPGKPGGGAIFHKQLTSENNGRIFCARFHVYKIICFPCIVWINYHMTLNPGNEGGP